MKLAIMQPYFLPYLGYFQLIVAANLFVVYDTINSTKKGWINRNRLLRDGRDAMFSLPLQGGPDQSHVCERHLAETFDRNKLINHFVTAYRRAPHFCETIELLESVVRYKNDNLFEFVHHAIGAVCGHLSITTPIRTASQMTIDHGLKSEQRVLALCEALGASTYINAIGGVHLSSANAFCEKGIDLKFIESGPFEYRQLGQPFVASLSIADAMMFNPIEAIREALDGGYELI
ncbi:MAG: hypothetical protein ACI9DC_000045 [Gammaproteobacteria bacterium]|jgi:hypothetical protein